MNIIPAIDLMTGGVVRLTKGDSNAITRYPQWGTPRQVAEKWEREGAPALHIVDLDAAKSQGDNTDVVKTILQSVEIPVQLGGGIRTRQQADNMFTLGVTRIVVGTLAFERPKDLRFLLTEYGSDRLMVALDYVNDHVMIRGWKTATSYTLQDALTTFLPLGVDTFLLTSISQDGLLAGPDCRTLKTIVDTNPANIYAAGGISSLQDLQRLSGVGVVGVVVGKALYEGKFTLPEAIHMIQPVKGG
jgi:phosphoribosylformimino-5-aminoimidazole carboxamide ribotide isomerase